MKLNYALVRLSRTEFTQNYRCPECDKTIVVRNVGDSLLPKEQNASIKRVMNWKEQKPNCICGRIDCAPNPFDIICSKTDELVRLAKQQKPLLERATGGIRKQTAPIDLLDNTDDKAFKKWEAKQPQYLKTTRTMMKNKLNKKTIREIRQRRKEKNYISSAEAFATLFGDFDVHQFHALLDLVLDEIKSCYMLMYSRRDLDYDYKIDYLWDIEKKLRVNLINAIQKEKEKQK